MISIRSRFDLDWGVGMTPPRPILTGTLMLALFALPLAVEAQQACVYRVGVVIQ